MKRIAYSFFLLALLSCGSSPSSSNHHIKIEFRDSVINDYYLLALRDSALLISPYTTDYASMDSLNAKAHVVPFSKIGRLYKVSSASLEDELWFGGTGCAMGGCTYGVLYAIASGYTGRAETIDFSLPLGATAAGLLLGVLVNNSYKELFLDTKEHLDLVKARAMYKEGEPYMLKLLH